MKKVLALILCAVLLTSLLVGCAAKTESASTPSASTPSASAAPTSAAPASTEPSAAPKITVKVGSKDFTEQLILGQISIQLLEAKGYTVVDKTNVSGSDVCWKALQSGDFDLYWEYTGTIWLTHLGNTAVPAGGGEGLYKDTITGLAKDGVIIMGDKTAMNDTYGLVVTQKVADLGIKSYSDLGKYMTENPGKLTIACDQEFSIRPDGLLGLSDAYGIDFGKGIKTMDMGLVFTALSSGEADVGMVFATDARIASNKLTLLADDKSYFPAYNGVACYRTQFAKDNPEIVDLMNQVAALIDDATMIRLNAGVDIDGDEPEEVAAAWLKEVGLIS